MHMDGMGSHLLISFALKTLQGQPALGQWQFDAKKWRRGANVPHSKHCSPKSITLYNIFLKKIQIFYYINYFTPKLPNHGNTTYMTLSYDHWHRCYRKLLGIPLFICEHPTVWDILQSWLLKTAWKNIQPNQWKLSTFTRAIQKQKWVPKTFYNTDSGG